MQRQQQATAAAMAIASGFGLVANDATVLQDSYRITLRLLPCDTLARVAPAEAQASAEFEVEIARRLAATGSPVAALEPRVPPVAYVRDGFVVNLWSYYEPTPQSAEPADYARALERLHAGMREIEIAAPHFTSRVAEAEEIVGSRDRSPELAEEDRELLIRTLRTVTRAIL
ncbi:MAG: aminoglycoside phosphotransferase family protein, partial [Dehalococcoidia bacterium]